jgi:ADP-heptose:LPS heptosyltransferase
MGIGANWIGKRWDAAHFLTTALALTGTGGALEEGRVALFGGPGDREGAAGFAEAWRGAGRNPARLIDTTGSLHLLDVQARLERCQMFIGNDSGLMHMAAAGGVPTLGLFGPSNEAWYAPRGPRAMALRGARSFADLRALDPDLDGPISLMQDLAPDRVIAAAGSLLEKAPP